MSADRSPRTSTCATITTHTVAWNNLPYCTAFRTRYFSGRKAISSSHTSFTPEELIPLFDRMASFFVAFIFVALIDSEGKWQRYPTAALMIVFIALLLWCIWTTWGGRANFVERVRNLLRSSPTPNRGRHGGQVVTPFQSIHVGPSPVPTSATQVY